MRERRRIVVAALWALTAFASSARGEIVTAAWNRNPEPDIQSYVVSYGSQPGQYTTTIDVGNVISHPLDLATGRYYIIVKARNAAGDLSLASPEVTLDLAKQPPAINPGSFNFAVVNSAGTLTQSTQPQALTIGTADEWTVSKSQRWITSTPGAGAGSGSIAIGVTNDGGLPASGSVSGILWVTTVGGTKEVTVNLLVKPAAAITAAPFGFFDTPADASTVQGSIAVTGWALDDIGIDRVEIWRDVAPGETTPAYVGPGPGNGKIFIATPLFVTGSRPDVEAAYPAFPLKHRAGWGYLLLTWGLFNQGNAPFNLYAFAFDREGQASLLGVKTIAANNNQATKPFGSIDVPAFGGVHSGVFFNFGWALTPNATPTCRINNGSVFVSIDSGPLVAVSYGDSRPDIAGAFSGFSNGSGAGGNFVIDATTLSNGTHQIGWLVTDSCGRADGIGSRFFTVLNSAPPPAAPALLTAAEDRAASSGGSPQLRLMNGDWTDLAAGAGGVHVVQVAEGERAEVRLPSSAAGYTAAHVVNGERRALPLGSSLDADQGIFYWQPAAGFLGSFDLEFLAGPPSTTHHPPSSVPVRIVVGPSMRMAIDTPAVGSGFSRIAVVQQAFTIAGWALDLAAADGSGVDTVHVWAYPAERGRRPIFLGITNVGDARADVAATYGAQFERSSYSLRAIGLSAGTYDIVVYAHRATGAFDAAQTVRVIVQR